MKNSNPWVVQMYMSASIQRVIRATATQAKTVHALEKCVNREDYWLCPHLVHDEYTFRPRALRRLSSVSSENQVH
jgi:carbohydrate-binding DOMON domain-containing protein